MQPPNLCQVSSGDNIMVCIMVEVMIVRGRVIVCVIY